MMSYEGGIKNYELRLLASYNKLIAFLLIYNLRPVNLIYLKLQFLKLRLFFTPIDANFTIFVY